jgi:hypothetical protein
LSVAVKQLMQMHAYCYYCMPLGGMRLITEVVTPARRVATISRRIVKLAHNVPTFLE